MSDTTGSNIRLERMIRTLAQWPRALDSYSDDFYPARKYPDDMYGGSVDTLYSESAADQCHSDQSKCSQDEINNIKYDISHLALASASSPKPVPAVREQEKVEFDHLLNQELSRRIIATEVKLDVLQRSSQARTVKLEEQCGKLTELCNGLANEALLANMKLSELERRCELLAEITHSLAHHCTSLTVKHNGLLDMTIKLGDQLTLHAHSLASVQACNRDCQGLHQENSPMSEKVVELSSSTLSSPTTIDIHLSDVEQDAVYSTPRFNSPKNAKNTYGYHTINSQFESETTTEEYNAIWQAHFDMR